MKLSYNKFHLIEFNDEKQQITSHIVGKFKKNILFGEINFNSVEISKCKCISYILQKETFLNICNANFSLIVSEDIIKVSEEKKIKSIELAACNIKLFIGFNSKHKSINETLDSLNLSYNLINCVKGLANFIEYTKLKKLNLSRNDIFNIQPLGCVLKTSSIVTLDLSYNNIVDINPLVNALNEGETTLVNLNLSNNKIEDSTVDSLFKILDKTIIKELDLSYNNLVVVSTETRNLKNLTKFSIAYNKLSLNLLFDLNTKMYLANTNSTRDIFATTANKTIGHEKAKLSLIHENIFKLRTSLITIRIPIEILRHILFPLLH